MDLTKISLSNSPRDRCKLGLPFLKAQRWAQMGREFACELWLEGPSFS